MDEDHQGAVRRSARRLLAVTAGDAVATQPWRHPRQEPDDVVLVRFALWHANRQVGAGPSPELTAGLALVGSAREELDALETALLFTARAEGVTWAQIAEAMGMRSPQAAQQRFQRVSQRPSAVNAAQSARCAGDE